MSHALDRLAECAGILPAFTDYFGNETIVSSATKSALLAAVGYDVATEASIVAALRTAQEDANSGLPPVTVVPAGTAFVVETSTPGERASWSIALENGDSLEGSGVSNENRRLRVEARVAPGYHRIGVRSGRERHGALIAVPDACTLLPQMQNGRMWALATQLYALRSQRNWGIGDFSDLRALAALASQAGGGAIALNPLHELFPSNPRAASPYGPSSRLFLNILYIDVMAVKDFEESRETQQRVAAPPFERMLRELRANDLVDYSGIASAKIGALTLLFAAFRRNHLERPGDRRASEFRAFVRNRGTALERLARYEALAEYFRARDAECYGWQQWPAQYRSPESPDVLTFAREHRDRVDFFCYAQWLADEQLACAARDDGVVLYRDLAVGCDRNGADAWGDSDAIAIGASLGAPADPLNTRGQNWGLPPFSPRTLRARAYAPFVELLRANMRHARILRIDHIMALQRAFWIPQGRPAVEGAYVRYPLDEMLGIVALESVRNGCAIVGEDLGTVPDGFRERLQDARLLSSRLVYFERTWDGAFLRPAEYPRLAAASVGTHDLPTLMGWWTDDGGDERGHARAALVDALAREGCIDAVGAQRLRDDALAGGTTAVAELLSEAVHRFLSRTPSMLAVVAIEDVLGETEGVNLPGTTDEHPNWQRKRSMPLEAFAADGRLFRIGAIMCDTEDMTSQRFAR